MEIHFTPDTEAQLSQLTIQTGQDAEQFVQDAVRYRLQRELQFREAVKRGENQLDRGEFLSSQTVWAQVEEELDA